LESRRRKDVHRERERERKRERDRGREGAVTQVGTLKNNMEIEKNKK
jgi:hypothetical protein